MHGLLTWGAAFEETASARNFRTAHAAENIRSTPSKGAVGLMDLLVDNFLSKGVKMVSQMAFNLICNPLFVYIATLA